MSLMASVLSGMTKLNTPQLHAAGDQMMNQANSVRLGGGNAAPLMARAQMFHQMAIAKSSFNSPDQTPTSPIRERTQPHLIHTNIHTGISSPGVSGVNPPIPSQSAQGTDIVGGGAQSALSSL